MTSGAITLTVYDALDVTKVIDGAGDGENPLLAEPGLHRRRVKELGEEQVAEARHWDDEPLLLIPLPPHHDRHAPIGGCPLGSPLLLPPVVAEVRHLETKPHRVSSSCHGLLLLLQS